MQIGQICASIHDIKPAAQIAKEIILEFEDTRKNVMILEINFLYQCDYGIFLFR